MDEFFFCIFVSARSAQVEGQTETGSSDSEETARHGRGSQQWYDVVLYDQFGGTMLTAEG